MFGRKAFKQHIFAIMVLLEVLLLLAEGLEILSCRYHYLGASFILHLVFLGLSEGLYGCFHPEYLLIKFDLFSNVGNHELKTGIPGVEKSLVVLNQLVYFCIFMVEILGLVDAIS